MKTLLFPFIFYIFWGPFVVPYVIRAIIEDLNKQNCYSRAKAKRRTFIIVTAIFLPVLAGGNGEIPVVAPWWFSVIAWFMDEHDNFYELIGYLIPSPFIAYATWRFISREVDNY